MRRAMVTAAAVAWAVSAAWSSPAVLEGRVTDLAGAPLPGATVRLYYRHEISDFGAQWLSEGRCDGQGRFRLPASALTPPRVFLTLPVRRLFVVAAAEGRAAQARAVIAGRDAPLLLALPPGRSLACQVADANDAPIKDAEVRLTPSVTRRRGAFVFHAERDGYESADVAGAVHRGRTDAQGRVTLIGVPAGEAVIEAFHPRKGSATKPYGEPGKPVRLTLQPGLDRVAGVVADEGGKPIPRMLVWMSVPAGTFWAETDAQGRYELVAPKDTLHGERAKSLAEAGALDPSPTPAYAAATAFSLGDRPDGAALEFKLMRGAALEGDVTNAATEQRLADAVVEVFSLGRRQRGVRQYRTTDANGRYAFRLEDRNAWLAPHAGPPGFVLLRNPSDPVQRVQVDAENSARGIRMRLAAETSTMLLITDTDGGLAAGARAMVCQPTTRARVFATAGEDGLAEAAGLAAGEPWCLYAVSADAGLAAWVGPEALPKAPAAMAHVQRTPVTLRPACRGTILFEDGQGKRLAGSALISMVTTIEGYLPQLTSARVRPGADKEGAHIAGLLPDTAYSVAATAPDRPTGESRFLAWRFGKDEKDPTLTARFERLRHLHRTEQRTEADLKKAIAGLQPVWTRPDTVQSHLTWLGLKSGLAMADAQRNTILQFDQMAGQEELTVTGMAFEPRRAWAATNRGLFAWDRDRQFWSLFAVGGIHLDSPVEDVSVTDDGTLVVTVRPEDAPPQRWTCDLERSEWRLP